MLITGIFVLIWINLFNGSYIFLFGLLFMAIFLLETYVDFVSICTHLSSPWSDVNNNQWILYPFKFLWSYITNKPRLIHENRSLLLREHTFDVQLRNQSRRLMFSRIQNLFRQTRSKTNNNKYSLFDYRCPVCLTNDQHLFRWIALGCGHILCSSCTQYLYSASQSRCPNCRSPIILSDLTILYI